MATIVAGSTVPARTVARGALPDWRIRSCLRNARPRTLRPRRSRGPLSRVESCLSHPVWNWYSQRKHSVEPKEGHHRRQARTGRDRLQAPIRRYKPAHWRSLPNPKKSRLPPSEGRIARFRGFRPAKQAPSARSRHRQARIHSGNLERRRISVVRRVRNIQIERSSGRSTFRCISARVSGLAGQCATTARQSIRADCGRRWRAVSYQLIHRPSAAQCRSVVQRPSQMETQSNPPVVENQGSLAELLSDLESIGFTFTRIRAGDKIPEGKWKTERITADQVVARVANGKNYGIVPPDGYFILDFDSEAVYQSSIEREPTIKQSLTFKTPRG